MFKTHDVVTDGSFEMTVVDIKEYGIVVRINGQQTIRYEKDLTMVREYVAPEKTEYELIGERFNRGEITRAEAKAQILALVQQA